MTIFEGRTEKGSKNRRLLEEVYGKEDQGSI
jgi:hypothetical protein